MNQNLTDGLPQEHVDDLLKCFFKKEFPDPWPEAQLSHPGRVSAGLWFGSHRRLALVASVALLLFGYLALAAKFPSAQEPGLDVNRNQTIGSKLEVKQPLPKHQNKY
jgi:hypothetical protein